MKTKLIKLSDTHYIVVDDSEIKLNDWVYSMDGVHQWFGLVLTTEPLPKKITHSTQPLEVEPIPDEKFPKVFDKIKRLSLSEVEEAINGYSIYQKALDFAVTSKIYIDDEKTHDEVAESLISFHKELVKDKLFTTEDIYNAVRYGLDLCLKEKDWAFGVSGSAKPYIKDYIQSLLPQTEWDITFDEQGKIKLV